MKTMVKSNYLIIKLIASHPPYSLDLALAPSDYWVFADTIKLRQGEKYGSNEEVIAETKAYFKSIEKSFYTKVIEKLE